MSQPGADLIRIERMRQVVSEGYTAEHDQGHGEELLLAAMCYVVAAGMVQTGQMEPLTDPAPAAWPWAAEFWKPTEDWRRMAVKAGALLAAALDADPAPEPEPEVMEPCS